MIPLNTTEYFLPISGIVDLPLHDPLLTGYPKTKIIGIAMQQEKDLSDTSIYCGTELIAMNYGKDYQQVTMGYDCDTEILHVSKTGNDEAFVSIVVLHDEPIYSYSTTTFTYTSDINTVEGFTHGELVSGMLLFLIFVMMFFGGIIRMTLGVKNKRSQSNYIMGNNTEEGKTFYYD